MKNYIITIARGYGSGGSHIGKYLSEKLEIPYYDTEIIQMAADVSGINEKYFFEANEKINKGKLAIMTSKGAYTGTLYDASDKNFLSNENIFNYQAKVIRELALEGKQSCIIIGKAANYILRTFPNVFSVNIQAPIEYCKVNIEDRLQKSPSEAEAKILETDKYRSNYYKYYTGREWLDPAEYDLSINTAAMGEEFAAQLIQKALAFKLGK
jgi:cytidylate kinase